MPVKSLYSVPASEVGKLKWGISKGQHVTHFFDGDSPDMIEINTGEAPNMNQVGLDQQTVYNTQSDAKTKDSFWNLMQLSATEYEKPGIDNEYKGILESIKAYITASHRATQQSALGDLNKKIAAYEKNIRA